MKLSKRNTGNIVKQAEKRKDGKPVQSKYSAKVRAQFKGAGHE